MKPYSDNIVFLDTEFSTLDPYKGEILSVGIVKMNGEELYIELEHRGPIEEWVKDNVMPYLTQEKVSRSKAVEMIRKFIGDSKPYIVAYVDNYDATYLIKLFGLKGFNEVFHWIPIDFASILFGLGLSPEAFDWRDENNFFKELGLKQEDYRNHHALDDALLLRDVYLKLTEKNE